jgi:hypothetical protein
MNRRRTVPREAAALPGGAEPATLGETPSHRASSRVRPTAQTIGIVRVKTPWFAPKFVVRAKCRAAVPEYEAIAALDEKLYVLTEDGHFGGIYVWRSRADAEAYYSPAWRQGVRERRGGRVGDRRDRGPARGAGAGLRRRRAGAHRLRGAVVLAHARDRGALACGAFALRGAGGERWVRDARLHGRRARLMGSAR